MQMKSTGHGLHINCKCTDERQFPCLLSYHQQLPAASISLILQGFGQLAQGLSCSMHPQAKSNWARQPGLFWMVLGAVLGDCWGLGLLGAADRTQMPLDWLQFSRVSILGFYQWSRQYPCVSTALKSCFGRQSGNWLG